MKIKFCGAATGVTGSCHLISTEKHKILLDCGQFQGGADADELNRADFPFNPAEIEAVVVSHAHVDHSGRLPLLVKRGFKGVIYATDATADLLDVMLKDCAHIAEQDAEQQNRKLKRAGKPLIEPLFSANDALDTLNFVKPVTYDTLVQINDQMRIVFNDAGHILGSAIIELWTEENGTTSKTVFSGDLGMQGRPILQDAKKIKKADYLIMETTYGNRLHDPNPVSVESLLEICANTTENGGNVVIPSFSVGRTQELIYELNKVYDGNTPYTKRLRNVPVYIDSPMSTEATEVFKRNAQDYNEEMKEMILSGDHPLMFKGLNFCKTSEESRAINIDPVPKIIISASGMCEAGRIRHHLKHNLWNPKSSVIFVGYQAEGSLGRYILDGAKEVKLFGETIAVNANIYNLGGFSGHADRDGLYDWLCGFQKKPAAIFLVHGEDDAKQDFADYVQEHKGWDCVVVDGYNEYQLTPDEGYGPLAGEAAFGGVPKYADSDTLAAYAAGQNDGEQAPAGPAVAEIEFANPDKVHEVVDRLEVARSNANDIIDNAVADMGGDIEQTRLVEIKNTLAALEKDIFALGALVSK